MDRDQIRGMIEELRGTGTDLDTESLALMHKVCCIIERMTSDRCRNLVSMAGKRPVLAVFMSDGWSCDIRQRVRESAGDVVVNRTTRLRTEFILQRSMIKTLIGSDMHFAVKIERPRPLAEKKCNDIWVAANDHMAMLKLQGHKGISITFYLQDGLMAKPFGKRMQARHKLFFNPKHCPLKFDDEADLMLSELSDWVFALNCAAHCASRALKWGLMTMVVGESLLEDVHILCSSLLRASTGLHKNVREFVARCVSFDRDPPDNVQDIEALWTSLDVEPHMLDMMVKVNPYFNGQKLRVSASLESEVDAINTVVTVVRYCMHWVDFSDTRWTKVGQAGRLFMRSVLIGINEIVNMTVADDAVSKWHLNGYLKRGSVAAKSYLAVSALAARPSESFLLELMEDDRFLIHYQRMWQVLSDEHQYLLGLPMLIYSTLAEVVHTDAQEFRSQVITCSVVSIGFLEMELWQPLSQPPFKYLIGNVHDNLAGLLSETNVIDVVSGKMQALAAAGFMEEVESACVLARESSWTTILVEQAHGSAAQIMHRHPQLEAEALCNRATVHNGRTLFYSGTFEKHEARLVSMQEELMKQLDNTKYTGPRQAYVSMLIAKVKASRVIGDPSEHALRRAVIKAHGKEFGKLSHAQVQELRKKAGVLVMRKVDSLSESLQHVSSQLKSLHERKAEAGKGGVVNHVDSIRFGPDDFLRFAELWDDFSASDLSKLQPPPARIPPAMEKVLLDTIDELQIALSLKPAWLSDLVAHRDEFQGVAFWCETSHPDCSVIFKYVVSLSQPQRAMFLQCERVLPAGSGVSVPMIGGVPVPVHRPDCFQYEALRFVDDRHVPWQNTDEVWIIPEVVFHGAEVRSTSWPLPWAVFTRYHHLKPVVPDARPPSSHSGRRVRVTQDMLAALLLEFPWLTLAELEGMVNTKAVAHSGGAGHGRSGGGQSSAGPVSEVPEAVIVAVGVELSNLREQVAEEQAGREIYFQVKVLGRDKSQARYRGLCTDFGVAPNEASIRLWAQAVGWPPAPGQKNFSVNKFGRQGARMLADELCNRSIFFMSSWVAAGSPAPYSFEDVAPAYVRRREFQDWLDDLPLSSDSAKAALIIHGLVPSPVPA